MNLQTTRQREHLHLQGDGMSMALLRSFDDLLDLAPEWDALAASNPAHSATQTFNWAAAGWSVRPPEDAICCLTVRRDSRLVCVWPLLIRTSGRRRLLGPLGSGGDEEYGGPLMASDAPAELIVARAWKALQREADVAVFHNIEAGSPLERELLRTRMIHSRDKILAPYISFEAFASWSEYFSSRSRNLRSDVRRQNKRLEALGQLRFGPIEDPDRISAGVEWMLLQKRRWLQSTGGKSPWMGTQQSQQFLTRAAIDGVLHKSAGVAAPRLFLLTLDGQTIAAAFALMNPTTLEFYITTYDPALENYSPGKVKLGRLARWSFDRGLTFDFRMVAHGYKEQWANAVTWRSTFVIATTARGLPLVAGALVRSLRSKTRKTLGRWLRRVTGRRLRDLLRVGR